MTSKDKRLEIKNNIRQKVWNFMRRNRVLMVSDIMAITGANYKYLKEMIQTFERGGYIKVLKRGKAFSSTQLKLLKYTGVKVPAYDKSLNVIYDYNTKEEIDVSKVLVIEKVLEVLTEPLMSKQEIAHKMNKATDSLKNQYAELVAYGVLVRTDPIEYNDNSEMLFRVNLRIVKEKKEQFEEERKQRLIERKMRAKTPQKPPKSLMKILDAMTKDSTTIRDMDRTAGVPLKTCENYWGRLLARGVVKKIEPEQRAATGGVLYKVYPNKAQKLKQKLLAGEKL